jgi:hypothetical protein
VSEIRQSTAAKIVLRGRKSTLSGCVHPSSLQSLAVLSAAEAHPPSCGSPARPGSSNARKSAACALALLCAQKSGDRHQIRPRGHCLRLNRGCPAATGRTCGARWRAGAAALASWQRLPESGLSGLPRRWRLARAADSSQGPHLDPGRGYPGGSAAAGARARCRRPQAAIRPKSSLANQVVEAPSQNWSSLKALDRPPFPVSGVSA